MIIQFAPADGLFSNRKSRKKPLVMENNYEDPE
jgi:hypothetical protein